MKDVPIRVPLHDITIKVERPADDNFTTALDAIFVDGLSQMSPFAPDYWRYYLAKHFPPPEGSLNLPAAVEPPLRKIGGGVSAPEILKKTAPEFNGIAHALQYTGTTTVNLVVNTSGHGTNLRLMHPIGLGLDDRAVAAVSQYVFKPAMENGSPVPVQVNVEISFRIE